ncbi:MAG: hypothetical protein BWK79_03805 [Beggiatoa sp. IS2]|nr:MAG: hypothetical protein BWK79_03805 [Beggiatoa sp. IS2]
MEELIENYGYWALFLGTLLEGEGFVIVASFFAFKGNLDLFLVIVIATTGAVIGDQIAFYLGYWGVGNWANDKINNNKKLFWIKQKAEKAQIFLAITSRLFYGFKFWIPFVIGILKMSPLVFFFCNLIGATFWAIGFSMIGYSSGKGIGLISGFRYSAMIEGLSLAAIVILFIVVAFLVRRKIKSKVE